MRCYYYSRIGPDRLCSCFVVLAFLISLLTATSIASASTVQIPDEHLRAEIKNELSLDEAEDITDGKMLELTYLYADDSNISNLEGLQYARNLLIADLRDNDITDISPLVEICVLGGFGVGSELTGRVKLENNYLDLSDWSQNFNDIQRLIDEGVLVTYEPQKSLTEFEITTVSLAAAKVGEAYTAKLTAIGGVEPYEWSVTAGVLPAGLLLDYGEGEISGVPTQAGIYSLALTVTDSANDTATEYFIIEVSQADSVTPPPTADTLAITTDTILPGAFKDIYYTATLAAQGGTTPYKWYLQAGDLPEGMNLSESGRLSGEPEESGSFSFIIRVDDAKYKIHSSGLTAAERFFLEVEEAEVEKPLITTNALPKATKNTTYRTNLSVMFGEAPYTWQLESGSLPSGIYFNSNGTITGIPTVDGVFPIDVQVTDALGLTATKSFSVTVEVPDTLQINTVELPTASRAGLYRVPLQASGGEGTYRWSLQAGRLPSGLSLLSEGMLSGTTMSTGSYNFSVSVRDGSGHSVTKALNLRVKDKDGINILTEKLPSLLPDRSCLQYLEAEGGEPPYTWSLFSGELPRGLTLHSNGVLTGKVQAEGEYSFTLQVLDQSGLFQEKSYILTVGDSSVSANSQSGKQTEIPDAVETVQVYIHGRPLQADTPPFLKEGRTFLPLRAIFEAMNAQVSWNEALRQATIKKENTEIILYAGKKEARQNESLVNLDAVPVLQNGRLMVPLRFIVETLGEQIRWDDKTREVFIGNN